MSLTEKWKAGELYGWCFCKILIENKEHICPVFISGGQNDFEIVEVLAPCDYNHIVELTEKVKTLEKEVIGGERIIGKMLNEGNAVTEENKHLRALLRECKNEFTRISTMACYPDTRLSYPADFDALFNRCEEKITRINAALGNNEIQANPVADIKIQESEE